MSDREFLDPTYNVVSIGPFRRYPVTVNSWSVPHLEAEALDNSEITLTLDHRLAVDIPADIAGRVIAFIADCMAVAKGYACHPRVDGWERAANDPPAPPLWPWEHYVPFGEVPGE